MGSAQDGTGHDEAAAMAAGPLDDALAALWFDWDTAYLIEVTDDGEWRARRRDGLGGWLTAVGPDELRQMIREDYAMKPVPRPDPPAGDGLPAADVAEP
jgi:hypothetical protein